MSVHTVDSHYMGMERIAACYLVQEGSECAFVEASTALAWPHLERALAERGLTAEDVRYLVVTHAHLDHAGGAWRVLEACPHATLLTHPRAAQHLIDPTRLVRSARGVYGDARFENLYGEIRAIPEHRVRSMDDEQVMRWGRRSWRFLHTRGHANHHVCLYDDVENGVFTGDAFGIHYPALQAGGGWAFPSTSPTDFDGQAALDTLDRLVDTGAKVAWPTHFGPVHDLLGARAQIRQMLRKSMDLVDRMDRDVAEEDLDGVAMAEVRSWFREAARARGFGDETRRYTDLDEELNAQGLAFAVRKRRYKRAKA